MPNMIPQRPSTAARGNTSKSIDQPGDFVVIPWNTIKSSATPSRFSLSLASHIVPFIPLHSNWLFTDRQTEPHQLILRLERRSPCCYYSPPPPLLLYVCRTVTYYLSDILIRCSARHILPAFQLPRTGKPNCGCSTPNHHRLLFVR